MTTASSSERLAELVAAMMNNPDVRPMLQSCGLIASPSHPARPPHQILSELLATTSSDCHARDASATPPPPYPTVDEDDEDEDEDEGEEEMAELEVPVTNTTATSIPLRAPPPSPPKTDLTIDCTTYIIGSSNTVYAANPAAIAQLVVTTLRSMGHAALPSNPSASPSASPTTTSTTTVPLNPLTQGLSLKLKSGVQIRGDRNCVAPVWMPVAGAPRNQTASVGPQTTNAASGGGAGVKRSAEEVSGRSNSNRSSLVETVR
jgi:hypothetical protein